MFVKNQFIYETKKYFTEDSITKSGLFGYVIYWLK